MNVGAVLLFIGGLGGSEVMVIMLVIILLFGAKKIPGLARSLGSGIREFKDATNTIKKDLESSINDDAPASSSNYRAEAPPVGDTTIEKLMHKKRTADTYRPMAAEPYEAAEPAPEEPKVTDESAALSEPKPEETKITE